MVYANTPPGPTDPPRLTTVDKPGEVRILMERCPTCFWHEGCDHYPPPPMKPIEHREDCSVFQCMRCGRKGRYPVGETGQVVCEEEPPTEGQRVQTRS